MSENKHPSEVDAGLHADPAADPEQAAEPAAGSSAPSPAASPPAGAEDLRHKQVFTTGEAAEICQVSQQTIIRCFDSNKLKGFRVPGSRFRRIPRDELVRFMKNNGMPADRLEGDRRRILVVDDDEHIVELFCDVLERDARFEVRTAATGYDAGMLTQQFRPDLIILDYMLPDINGNVVCKTIRQNAEFNDTKIVVVSGVVNQDEITQLLDSGADDFVKKPFNIEKLVGRIHELLEMPDAVG